ncbi:MAG: hypothetical protein HQ488_02620 [Parcubacteria group bacterium]|nr:hypothetical protein [Parcubacteria group bacterium]
MKLFETSKWVYGRVDSAQTLLQLPEELKVTLPDSEILSTVSRSGGKALGLKICEMIASGAKHLTIPSWMGLSIQDQIAQGNSESTSWLASQCGQVHVRSSARSEDWIDGAAGRHTSVRSSPEDVFQNAQVVSRWRSPVVIQEHIPGIGIVVDIAHSHVLDQPVIRVATGREVVTETGVRTFTSATWDYEGRHELYEPNTGRQIAETRTGNLFVGACMNLPLWEIAKELWYRVKDLGIDFGVQLELIVHPDTPWIWNLVQIRPSPNRVRVGAVEIETLANPLTTTGIVSSAFNTKAMARLLTSDDESFLAIFGVDADLAKPEGRFDGTPTVVWENDPSSDFGLFQMRGAFSSGIALQVTRRVLMINTTHTRVYNREPTEKAALLRDNGVIAVPDDVHAQLVTALRGGPRMIHAVSDGIVGQISLP